MRTREYRPIPSSSPRQEVPLLCRKGGKGGPDKGRGKKSAQEGGALFFCSSLTWEESFFLGRKNGKGGKGLGKKGSYLWGKVETTLLS